MRRLLASLFAILFFSSSVFASYSSISKKIDHLEKENKIRIGVSAIHIESGKFFHHRADDRFKMASAMKLPVAIYLLDKVSRNKASLRHMIHLEPYDLIPGSGQLGYFLTYPSLSISVQNLLESMMAISDNTSTDMLLHYIGGVKAVMRYLKDKGFNDISINNNIEELFEKINGVEFPKKPNRDLKQIVKILESTPLDIRRKASKKMHENDDDTASPRDMTRLLVDLQNGSLIGKDLSELLLETMSHCLDNRRIKGDLPKRIKVAHKTGSWDKNLGKGQNYGYFSDVGIIYLPQEKGHIAISIFTSSKHTSSRKKHLGIIAKVARMIYDELPS